MRTPRRKASTAWFASSIRTCSKSNFSDATVVTLYLLPGINLKLRPKLWKELKPGTRIVSHSFDMGDWEPQKKTDVDGRILYFWTIPARPAAKA